MSGSKAVPIYGEPVDPYKTPYPRPQEEPPPPPKATPMSDARLKIVMFFAAVFALIGVLLMVIILPGGNKPVPPPQEQEERNIKACTIACGDRGVQSYVFPHCGSAGGCTCNEVKP